jgi:hypothetical protein
MLHSSVANTVSHKSVSFDGIRMAQNGSAIGPLPLAQQFNPPLNANWQFYEWNGSSLTPLSLAGASLGGSALEEVQFTDQIVTPGSGLFTGDPGLGKKLYVSADSNGSPRYDVIADLFNFDMRNLSAGPGHPKSDRCAPGCYRGFYSIPPSSFGWGKHTDTSWGIHRRVAANTAISSWSLDTGPGDGENNNTAKQAAVDKAKEWWNHTSSYAYRSI